jgi:pyridoxine kinase
MLALEVKGAGGCDGSAVPGAPAAGSTLAGALSTTASTDYAVLEEAHRTGSREMRLVSAQESVVEPPRRFEASQTR